MSFFAVLCALLIEQLRPLPRNNWVHDSLIGWVRWTGRNFDAGKEHHAWVVWCITVLTPAVLVALVYLVTVHFSLLLALAWNVLVLYLTLGFRHFSHYFTDIRDALERGDELTARQLLAEWRHLDASELPRAELLRHVIEHSVLAAHRHVFGVLVCFVVLAMLGLGPAGAVLYRMAEFLSRTWRAAPQDAPSEALQQVAAKAWGVLDFVPARVTALGFAVAGNFEEAVASWRQDSDRLGSPNDGVVLAATRPPERGATLVRGDVGSHNGPSARCHPRRRPARIGAVRGAPGGPRGGRPAAGSSTRGSDRPRRPAPTSLRLDVPGLYSTAS